MKKNIYTFTAGLLVIVLSVTGLQLSTLSASQVSPVVGDKPAPENPWNQMEEMAPTKAQKKLIRKLERREKKLIEKGKLDSGEKSWEIALLLSLFLGYLAVDRFYLGYIGSGILKLMTIGFLGVWYMIDVLLIAFGILQPKNGRYMDKSTHEFKA